MPFPPPTLVPAPVLAPMLVPPPEPVPTPPPASLRIFPATLEPAVVPFSGLVALVCGGSGCAVGFCLVISGFLFLLGGVSVAEEEEEEVEREFEVLTIGGVATAPAVSGSVGTVIVFVLTDGGDKDDDDDDDEDDLGEEEAEEAEDPGGMIVSSTMVVVVPDEMVDSRTVGADRLVAEVGSVMGSAAGVGTTVVEVVMADTEEVEVVEVDVDSEVVVTVAEFEVVVVVGFSSPVFKEGVAEVVAGPGWSEEEEEEESSFDDDFGKVDDKDEDAGFATAEVLLLSF